MAYHQNSMKVPQDQILLQNIQEYLPDLEITLLDLKNPTHNAVCNFYTAFLEELGANAANVVQVSSAIFIDTNFWYLYTELFIFSDSNESNDIDHSCWHV